MQRHWYNFFRRSEIPDFQIINIYNKKSLKENCNDWTLNRILSYIKPQKYSIIYGDFNAHHSWWNLDISNSIRANELVQWLNQHQFKLLNEPDIPTFYRQNIRNISIINLAFATKALNQSKSIFLANWWKCEHRIRPWSNSIFNPERRKPSGKSIKKNTVQPEKSGLERIL